jgi:hypothetical protein
MTIDAKLRPILLGPVVDILKKPLEFLDEITKGDGFDLRHSRQFQNCTSGRIQAVCAHSFRPQQRPCSTHCYHAKWGFLPLSCEHSGDSFPGARMGGGARGGSGGRTGAARAAGCGRDSGRGSGDCNLLLFCAPWFPSRSLQSESSLLKNCILYIHKRRLLDRLLMEFLEFSDCFGFMKTEVQFH